MTSEPTRREFLGRAAAAALLTAVPRGIAHALLPPPRRFVNIVRSPDAVSVQTADGDLALERSGTGWASGGVTVSALEQAHALRISLAAPGVGVKRLHMRWRGDLSATRLILGDAWERGYGDLEWRGWVPDRVMPWYMAISDGATTHGYGVRTGPSALCFWMADPQGISLWMDVRSGGVPVRLGERVLEVCDAVCREGHAGESAFAAMHAFCRVMCPSPRLPANPVYGSNDWYWAYGKNSADSVRLDAKHIVELSPAGTNRPFAVIDDGWQPEHDGKAGVGKWDAGNAKFGDMARLASEVKGIGARPGIWIRPLQAEPDTPPSWRLARDKQFLDPTVPDVLEKVRADMARLRTWGYELIKHDYTTFDVSGRWGSQMGYAMTREGWQFASGPGSTTAEIIRDLYSAIRTGAGDALIIGCNTISHLSAGQFEICRVGDDTSGTEWGRTRKMGVNTLAFRGAQHGAFYVADADCVGVTTSIPWALNRQWLDLLARSGTTTFVSLDPGALGAVQRDDLTNALALAAVAHPLGEPLDWLHTVYPSRWRLMGRDVTYDWNGNGGTLPP